MSTVESGARAFGGGPLAGDNWVRIAYLDESGTGSIESDPFLVVAGVIVDADGFAAKLTKSLHEILHMATPPGIRVPRYLHAKDIWHGTKEYDKMRWPHDRRMQILKALSLCPVAHMATVVYGAVDRAKLRQQNPGLTQRRQDEIAYAKAATLCIFQIERFMRERANEGEIASITFEAGPKGSRLVKEIANSMRFPKPGEFDNDVMQFLPLTRIIDNPNFQEKTDSSILQLADYCAFALKRRETGSVGWEALCEEFLRCCFGKWAPKSDGEIPG